MDPAQEVMRLKQLLQWEQNVHREFRAQVYGDPEFRAIIERRTAEAAMTAQEKQSREVYEAIKKSLVQELTYWMLAIRAGVPVENFERRLAQVSSWEWGGGENTHLLESGAGEAGSVEVDCGKF
jgi:hypothetical protein